MSNEESTPPEEVPAIDDPQDESDDGPQRDERDIGAQMLTYAQWAAFALLLLVALIATVRLYFAASAAIDTFVTRRFRPLFMAGFNLAVVLACGLGLSALVRRLA
jgi:hypothetical protein